MSVKFEIPHYPNCNANYPEKVEGEKEVIK